MELGMPVFHPSIPGHVLLRPGFVLDKSTLTRLNELHVGPIWIKYPALEEIARFINVEVTMEHAQLSSLIGRTLDKLADPLFSELDFRVYADAVKGMLGKLRACNESALLINELVGCESPLAMHSSTVCFISLLMGLKLGEYIVEQRPKVSPKYAKGVENLGVAALFHDMGMLKLAPEVVEAWKKTGDESDPRYQRHCAIGYELLRGKVEPTTAATVLQHHQRYDGQGWPKIKETNGVMAGLSGEGIHVFARILAVADLYDTLRNPPKGEWREDARVPIVAVLRQMLELARKRVIDPIAYKALLSVVPAFTPGTIVRLNNGQQAVVIDFDPMHPCRPRVRHIRYVGIDCPIDPENLRETYDLRERLDLAIVAAEGHAVKNDTFEAADEHEFDLRVLALPKQATANPGQPRTGQPRTGQAKPLPKHLGKAA